MVGAVATRLWFHATRVPNQRVPIMRPAAVLIVLVACSLSFSAGPQPSTARVMPAVSVVSGDGDDGQYQALQRQADIARDTLRQARERRAAAARFTVN